MSVSYTHLDVYKRQLDDGSIAAGIAKRRIFPCCFGSALKMQGVDELLEIVSQFSLQKIYPAQFGARVFKISRDPVSYTHLDVYKRQSL